MIPSLERWPTKAKEASSHNEVRLTPLDTNPLFQCLGENLLIDKLILNHITYITLFYCQDFFGEGFLFCLYTDFFNFILQVQTHPNFSLIFVICYLIFVRVMLFLKKIRNFLRFWSAKRSCDQFCAKSEPKRQFFEVQAASLIFLILLGNNFMSNKIVLKKSTNNYICTFYVNIRRKPMSKI